MYKIVDISRPLKHEPKQGFISGVYIAQASQNSGTTVNIRELSQLLQCFQFSVFELQSEWKPFEGGLDSLAKV